MHSRSEFDQSKENDLYGLVDLRAVSPGRCRMTDQQTPSTTLIEHAYRVRSQLSKLVSQSKIWRPHDVVEVIVRLGLCES